MKRVPSVTGIAPPPDGFTTWDDYMVAVETNETVWIDKEAERGLKAMRLSPTLTICRAFLSGQPVPRDALNQEWAKRYGL